MVTPSPHQVWLPESAKPSAGPPPAAVAHRLVLVSVYRLAAVKRCKTMFETTMMKYILNHNEHRCAGLTCSQCLVHSGPCVLPPAGPAGWRSSPSQTPPAALSAICSRAGAWWTFLWTIPQIQISVHTDCKRGTIRNSVSNLYSMGNNSAARFSWPGLLAGSIPAEEKSVWKQK